MIVGGVGREVLTRFFDEGPDRDEFRLLVRVEPIIRNRALIQIA